jgi:hypothetical protein
MFLVLSRSGSIQDFSPRHSSATCGKIFFGNCPPVILWLVVFMSEQTINQTTKDRNIMKRIVTYSTGLLVITGALVAGLALAESKTAPAVDPQMAEMMKKMEIAAAPGAAHKALEPFVGNWKAEVKTWMTPGQPPTVTKGSAKSTWVMNGRYVQEEFSGEIMGKPFRGMSLTGYDNVRQKYSSVWVDDMSTSIVTSEGDADAAGKVFTFNGDYACAMTGDKHRKSTLIYRIISKDKHVFEMHDPAQANAKMMEITYTRK